MIAALSGRRSFEQLRAQGHRRRKGPITVISRRLSDQPPRVAFAVSSTVGNAVLRNRIKRRIRQVVRELAAGRDAAGRPALGGDHLIRVHAPIEHWSHRRLVDAMTELLAAPSAGADAGRGKTAHSEAVR